MRSQKNRRPFRAGAVMRLSSLLLVVVAPAVLLQSLAGSAAQQKPSSAPASRIVRLDPRFDQLVPRRAVLEKVADGFHWVEGPVWNRSGNYLLFSDIPNNSVFKWQPGAGVSLF